MPIQKQGNYNLLANIYRSITNLCLDHVQTSIHSFILQLIFMLCEIYSCYNTYKSFYDVLLRKGLIINNFIYARKGKYIDYNTKETFTTNH